MVGVEYSAPFAKAWKHPSPTNPHVMPPRVAPSRARRPASASYRARMSAPVGRLTIRAVTRSRISPIRAKPYFPGQAVAPTSRWAKTVGRVALAPETYFDVPPPLEVSTVVPRGSTPYNENFQAMIAATASTVTWGTGTSS